jgi:hypothetical protein
VGVAIWKTDKFLFQEPTDRNKRCDEMALYQSFCGALAAQDYLEQRPPTF